MPIYKLIPSAPPDDPMWSIAINQGEVIVRAPSSGEARAIAALQEFGIAVGGIPKSTTQVVASAFRNEELYTVRQDQSGEFPEAGPFEVLRGTFQFPKGYVLAQPD